MEYKKNSKLKLTITDVGISGEGIGKVDGYTLFVKDAVPGDEVQVVITKAKKNYAYAKCEKVLRPSPFRVQPNCACYRPCGGCQLQAMNYERQLIFKNDKVRNNLIRIGGFETELVDQIMDPIVGMKEPFHYRNKAQYPIGTDKNGRLVTGFYAERSHSIISNTDCMLGSASNKAILESILHFMQTYHITAYQEEKHSGLVRHVLIRTGFTTGEIMVCLVINGRKLPQSDAFVQKLLKLKGIGEHIKSISVNVNLEDTNVIMGKEISVLYGQSYITDYIGDIAFQISPLSFYQVNPVQTRVLYGTALEYADLKGTENVWDLYCGIGTISLFLAQKAGKVFGIEVVEEAIQDAERNAMLNHMENTEFLVGKVEEVLPQIYEEEHISADVIVVDPPRKGCEQECLDTILKMKPQKVIYVSCDSATLARDLKVLCEKDYELKKVKAVDMFPQTVHVETVVLLSQLKPDDHIEIDVDTSEFDVTSAEKKATYQQIEQYVMEHTGLKVSNLYIAQVKDKYGLDKRLNYNLPKSENARQPKCPPEKEKAIEDALRYFKMI